MNKELHWVCSIYDKIFIKKVEDYFRNIRIKLYRSDYSNS